VILICPNNHFGCKANGTTLRAPRLIILLELKVKLSLCLTKHHIKKTYIFLNKEEVLLHAFLTSALDRSEWSASCSSRFIPEVRAPSIHCTRGWVGLRAGMNAVAKRKNSILPLPGTEQGHPACSLVTILTEQFWLHSTIKHY
jgi:hypothetical protein